MKKKITVIEGDGIGPEVTRQSIHVLNAVAARFAHEFEYTYCLMGADAIDKTGVMKMADRHRQRVSGVVRFGNARERE